MNKYEMVYQVEHEKNNRLHRLIIDYDPAKNRYRVKYFIIGTDKLRSETNKLIHSKRFFVLTPADISLSEITSNEIASYLRGEYNII